MSKYNSYAQRMKEVAESAFADYRQAEKAYKAAEQKASEYQKKPLRLSLADAARYEADRLRVTANLEEAKAAFKTAQRTFSSRSRDISAIRDELAAEIEAAALANPEQVDANIMTLLQSGVLKAADYDHLMDQAGDNVTMQRIIGKFADDAIRENGLQVANTPDAFTLRSVSNRGKMAGDYDRLEMFDSLSRVFDRCVNNPTMIDSWSELTGDAIESF